MEIMLLSKLDNLLSRIDEKNKLVFLKKDQELEKITFQNLFMNSNSFSQLSLRSKSEVVCLDLHQVLQLSPFLTKLVAELRHCCFSPHDQVDICLDQFSPHLLNIIKNLLEHGECTVKSSLEGKQLEALIQAMGMDSSMQLYRRIHIEKPTTVLDSKENALETNIHVDAANEVSKVLEKNVNIENKNVSDSLFDATNSRKRKLSGDKNKRKLGFKLRQCKKCKQSYNASQNHICVNTSDKEILNTNGEDEEGEIRLEASRDDQECKRGIENNADEIKSESNQKSCPQCDKVYKMLGAGPKAFIKHIQACKDGAAPKEYIKQTQPCEDGVLFEAEKGDESEDIPCPRCGKLYKRSGAGKVYFERHKQNCFKRNYGEEYETDKIHSDIEKPKGSKNPIETKNLIKGRGVTHDKYITKLPATVAANQVNDFSDLVAPQKVACPVKERKPCPSCGKLYFAEGRGAMYDVHVAKCKAENIDGGVYDISLFVDPDEKDETESKQTYECFECRKIFNVKHHFQKHIQFCQVESADSKPDRKSLDFMQCEKCERIFVGSEAFTKHQAGCSQVKEKLPCPHGCGKQFIYKGRLKNHFKNCPMMKMNATQNLLCKICGEGEFNENDLYLHLYKRHEELRKKIHKSVSANIANYYSLEAKKLNCICPICDLEMKAARHKVGIHWAVVHKKIKCFYNLYLKDDNGIEKDHEKESKCEETKEIENKADKESKSEDVEKMGNIEDYEEIIMDDQELNISDKVKDGSSIQETDHNEKSIKQRDEKLQDGNPIPRDEEESSSKICITNVRAIGTNSSLRQQSRPRESVLKEEEVISNKAPSTTKHENSDKDLDGDAREGVGRDVKESRVIRNELFSESESDDGSN